MTGRGGFIVVGCLLALLAVFLLLVALFVVAAVPWWSWPLAVAVGMALGLASNPNIDSDLQQRLAAWWRMDKWR